MTTGLQSCHDRALWRGQKKGNREISGEGTAAGETIAAVCKMRAAAVRVIMYGRMGASR
jgi:hypothetical protein